MAVSPLSFAYAQQLPQSTIWGASALGSSILYLKLWSYILYLKLWSYILYLKLWSYILYLKLWS